MMSSIFRIGLPNSVSLTNRNPQRHALEDKSFQKCTRRIALVTHARDCQDSQLTLTITQAPPKRRQVQNEEKNLRLVCYCCLRQYKSSMLLFSLLAVSFYVTVLQVNVEFCMSPCLQYNKIISFHRIGFPSQLKSRWCQNVLVDKSASHESLGT